VSVTVYISSASARHLTINVSIAYSYTTRHLAISPLSTIGREATDIQDSQKLIAHLVPFLVDRKSTTLYPNLSSLMPELWSRFKLVGSRILASAPV
jgi:hypothetical protein